MTRLVASDKGVRGIDVQTPNGTHSYNTDRKGIINVENPKHVAQMKSEGFFEASLMGPTTNGSVIGYTCVECGFGSFFRKCGRCGTENKDTLRDGEI